MDGVNGVGAPPSAPNNDQQQPAQGTQSDLTPEQQAAFESAVERFVGSEIVADHFLLQGLINETMSDSTS